MNTLNKKIKVCMILKKFKGEGAALYTIQLKNIEQLEKPVFCSHHSNNNQSKSHQSILKSWG